MDDMPTYNYYCGECDDHFSCFQKMSEEPFSICKKCGHTIERIITGGTGLIFKGSGFYLTDYKNGKENPNDVVKKDQSEVSKKNKINKNNSKIDKKKLQSTSNKSEKSDE